MSPDVINAKMPHLQVDDPVVYSEASNDDP